MPNYLDGSISAEGVEVGASISDSGSNYDNVGVSASVQSASASVGPVSFSFGFGAGSVGAGGGSKPEALHTEYATEGDDGPAYGTQDLIFYLQRADVDDDPATGEQDTDGVSGVADRAGDATGAGAGAAAGESWNNSSSGKSAIEAGGASGPQPDNGSIQSGMNQIAAGGYSVGRSVGGPFAPIGDIDFEEKIDLGKFSQNAARFVDVADSVINAVRSVEELNEHVVNYSFGSSERLFAKVINRSFSPELEDVFAERNADQILETLNRPSVSELSFLLAASTTGRIRIKDIVQAVNDGELGFVSYKSRAFQERMNKSGRARL